MLRINLMKHSADNNLLALRIKQRNKATKTRNQNMGIIIEMSKMIHRMKTKATMMTNQRDIPLITAMIMIKRIMIRSKMMKSLS